MKTIPILATLSKMGLIWFFLYTLSVHGCIQNARRLVSSCRLAAFYFVKKYSWIENRFVRPLHSLDNLYPRLPLLLSVDDTHTYTHSETHTCMYLYMHVRVGCVYFSLLLCVDMWVAGYAFIVELAFHPFWLSSNKLKDQISKFYVLWPSEIYIYMYLCEKRKKMCTLSLLCTYYIKIRVKTWTSNCKLTDWTEKIKKKL